MRPNRLLSRCENPHLCVSFFISQSVNGFFEACSEIIGAAGLIGLHQCSPSYILLGEAAGFPASDGKADCEDSITIGIMGFVQEETS